MAQRLRLVVVADSFAFTDDRGPQLPTAPTLFPRVLAGELERVTGRGVDLTVLARAGQGVRDVWRTLTKDQHVQFEVLPGADAVVMAVGSFDHVPTGVPAALPVALPFLRPTVRRWGRRAIQWSHPRVVALTDGRFALTPTAEFATTYGRVLDQLRALAGGAPGAAMGPSGHRSPYYAYLNPHLAARERLQLRIAEEHGYAAVPIWDLVEPHLDRLNPDGVHWPADVHAQVGRALAQALLQRLDTRAS